MAGSQRHAGTEVAKVTLVLCNGVFDLLHAGHLAHLEEARDMGTHLVVGVTMDEYVRKGDGRPVENVEERLAKLRALRIVTAATPCRDAVHALELWQPTIFCKGIDYKGKGLRQEEIEFCDLHGIKIAFTRSQKLSTGDIIERIRKCHVYS